MLLSIAFDLVSFMLSLISQTVRGHIKGSQCDRLTPAFRSYECFIWSHSLQLKYMLVYFLGTVTCRVIKVIHNFNDRSE